MTIIFPRELPAVDYVTADFILLDPVASSPSGKRRINYTQVNDPAWQATMVTRSLIPSDYAAVEAWWLSLREGLRRVLFRHPHVWYPKNHGTNQAPADDAAVLASVANGNELSVTGVSPELVLVAGDRIGLERQGRYYIGRVTEVSGAGTSRTLSVEPLPFDTVAVAGAVVRFARPALVMRPIPGSFSAPLANGRYAVSFQLVEAQ